MTRGTATGEATEDPARLRNNLWQLQLERIRATAAPVDAIQHTAELDRPGSPYTSAPAGGADAMESVATRSGMVRRLGTAALTVLLLAATAFLLFVAYGTTVDNRWYKIVAIEGGSMAPAIEQGDAILITRPPATLKAGMVVVLQVERRLVTHRVVAVHRDGSLVTRGDANDHVDDWTNLDVRVVGVVQGHLPLLGRLLRTVGSGSWLNDQSDLPVSGTTG